MRKTLLFLGDILILYAALFFTLLIRYGHNYYLKLPIHLTPFSIIFLIWLLIYYIANLYEVSLTKNDLHFFSTFFSTIAVNAAISIIFFYLIKYFRIAPKTNLLLLIAIVTILQTLWRLFFNKLLAISGYRNNTLIIGDSDQSQELYDYLLANPQLGYGALGIIDIAHDAAHDILAKVVTQKNVRTLVLSPSAYKVPRIIDVLYGLIGFRLNFYNLSSFYERATGRVPLGAIDQAWFLDNLTEGRQRGYELAKRSLDLVFGVLIGVITLPFYPFVMLAIKLDSAGPIFFRQKRTGRAGKTFTLVKFRNMVANSPDGSAEGASGPVWAAEDDKRATRVGKLIRRTRIDELPQVWNVIKGQMSFVGPRPERPEFHDKLRREIPFYQERYLVKPGLTGWAQIKHKLDFRGGMTIADTAEKLRHDLYYVKNRSLLLDLEIILKTFSIILKKVFK